MIKRISVELPLSDQTIQSLKVGDHVHLSGIILQGEMRLTNGLQMQSKKEKTFLSTLKGKQSTM